MMGDTFLKKQKISLQTSSCQGGCEKHIAALQPASPRKTLFKAYAKVMKGFVNPLPSKAAAHVQLYIIV